MAYTTKKIIHRFIRDIADYEEGGELNAQIIPLDTQIYALYNKTDKTGLYFVIGDGIHTYTEIRDGYGAEPVNKEYNATGITKWGSILGNLPDQADLQAVLTAEQEAREAADTKLQENIDAEAQTRSAADTALNDAITTHVNDKDNPHEVTKTQVGLSNVKNVDTTDATNITSGTLSNDRLGTIPFEKLSGVASAAQGEKADTAIQPKDNVSKLTNDAGYINKDVDNLTNYTLTTVIDEKLDKKQDTINDLETIRSGAKKGATSLQPSDVINNVTSSDTDKPLSANMGKSLQEQISNLKQIGRFLSLWNCATGLPTTNPETLPYTYKTGDYYIVSVVRNGTNYRPDGAVYTGAISTKIETETVVVNDIYFYDGNVWKLLVNAQRTVTFANIAGQPTDNTNLAVALNAKQDAITNAHKLASDLVDDTNQSHLFVSDIEKLRWNNKLEKNTDITPGKHTKITYDKKGLVTYGEDLTAADIPDLTLVKITDVTASAAELNTLDGIITTTKELNYVAGTTSNIQNQLNTKAVYPSQLGQNGKFLKTDGTKVSWEQVDALPSQSGHSGQYLTTNGSDAYWNTVTVPTKLSELTGDVNISVPTNDQVLKYNASTGKWENGTGGGGGGTGDADGGSASSVYVISQLIDGGGATGE